MRKKSFLREKNTSVRRKYSPRGNNHFRKEWIVSARKKSFPRGRTLSEVCIRRMGGAGELHPRLVMYEVFFFFFFFFFECWYQHTHTCMCEVYTLRSNLTSWRGVLLRGKISASWRWILPVGKFLPRGGNLFLAEIFLPQGIISSLWIYVVFAEMIFSSQKWFLPIEMFSYSQKLFLSCGNDFFLAEMISGIRVSHPGFGAFNYSD